MVDKTETFLAPFFSSDEGFVLFTMTGRTVGACALSINDSQQLKFVGFFARKEKKPDSSNSNSSSSRRTAERDGERSSAATNAVQTPKPTSEELDDRPRLGRGKKGLLRARMRMSRKWGARRPSAKGG